MTEPELTPMLPYLWEAHDPREILAKIPEGRWRWEETVMRISDEGL